MSTGVPVSQDPLHSAPPSLRWRSRRGMRELDVLLTRWLEQRWPAAGADLRSDFEALLNCEDDQLWDWLLGRSEPEAPGLKRIVHDIRSPDAPQP